MKKQIVVPRRKKINSTNQVTLTPEAVQCLLEVMQETGLNIKTAASTIIIQAVKNDLIVYEDEDTDDETN